MALFNVRKKFSVLVFVLVLGVLWAPSPLMAGPYIFAGEANGVDLILHPTGYTGAGGVLNLNVCITPGTPNEAAMEQSVRNIIATYNQRLPTTGNLRAGFLPSGVVDFESVALHELGHCIGKAHVNAASESGLGHPDIDSTKSTDGLNGVFETNAGADGLMGSSDDIRGDDVNLHWYRAANNNPFTMDYDVVDSSTYARSSASLPAGHLFAANGDRDVATFILNTPSTEAVLQQGTYFRELQRTLTPDGVATLDYAMAGLDEVAGTADDYAIQLNFANNNCDINISFDIPAGNGLAYCSVGGGFVGGFGSGHVAITTATMNFNDPDFNWFFNTATPCTESISLVPFEWKLFTLPCSVGISTGNTVADVLGDDFAGLNYVTEWVVWRRDAQNDVYTQMLETDPMFTGQAYWVITSEVGITVDFEGQFNGSPDTLLAAAPAGRANMVGNPFEFNVDWANVQVVDGAEVQTLAAAVADGDIQEAYQTWNGNAWQAFDASTPGMIGTLFKSEGIWMKVMKAGVRLRVPAIVSAVVAPADFTANTNRLQTTAASEANEVTRKHIGPVRFNNGWHLRLVVESDGMIDAGNVIGQIAGASLGLDKHDLEELEPFGQNYLTIVFPRDDGAKDAWAYTSDFRPLTKRPKGKWEFTVLASENVGEVSLHLEGPKQLLRKVRLFDLQNGKRIKAHKGAYTFKINEGENRFRLKIRK